MQANVPSMSSSPSSGTRLKSMDLEPNIAAALSYLFAPVTGIIFFLMEKENKFVRFHAFQAILFGIAAYVATTIAGALTTILIGFLLVPIVSLAALLLGLMLMWKAYNNMEYELPILGKIAHDQANK
ncbi:DUF4870 domain-containing protein [Patescibacteria group bacterium]|nr:DUF4870 domain-containing protein [Patescibacteria group bacterium]